MTQRLRQLERDGLIVRTYHPRDPRPEWSTRSATSAAAWLRCSPSLAEWATTNLDKVEHARHDYDAGSAR